MNYFLATDFDDTLYFHDGRGLRTKDIEAIRRFQKSGSRFGLNTGRSVSMYKDMKKMIEGDVQFDFLIFANGTYILNQKGEVVYQKFLPKEFLNYVMENVRDIPVTFHHETGLYSSLEPSQPVPGMKVMNLDYSMLPDLDINEISIDYALPGAEKVIADLKKQPGIVCAKNSKFCDFNPEGTSKGKGLDIAAGIYGFNHQQTAAIGDSFNDIPMIADAACGFTFAESAEEVREAADQIVDGVAGAIDFLMTEDH